MSLSLSIMPNDPDRNTLLLRLPQHRGVIILRSRWRCLTPEERVYPTLLVEASVYRNVHATPFTEFIRPYDESRNTLYLPLPEGTSDVVTCSDGSLLAPDTVRVIYRPDPDERTRYSGLRINLDATDDIEIIRSAVLRKARVFLDEYADYAPHTTRIALEQRLRELARQERQQRVAS